MFAILAKKVKQITLWIVGTGDVSYRQYLENLAKTLGIDKQITFYGFVSQEKKFELMARSHILVNPSIKEGWGLTVPEAGAVGTPCVVYNVAGLRDLVQDGVNGLLAPVSPGELAQKVLQVLTDISLYKKLRQGAQKKSLTYNWDNTESEILSVLKRI
jgi:glycosyltransferase involved in cell wall biosynthesis